LATAEGLQVKGLSNVRATRPSSGQQIQNSQSASTLASEKSDNSYGKGTTFNSSDLSSNRVLEGTSAERNHNTSNHSNTTNSPHHLSSPISSTLPHNNSSPRRTQSSSSASVSWRLQCSSDISLTTAVYCLLIGSFVIGGW